MSEEDLRSDPVILLVGAAVVRDVICIARVATALASTVLGTLTVAGAEVDVRTYMPADTVTAATLVTGILAALMLNPFNPVFPLRQAK